MQNTLKTAPSRYAVERNTGGQWENWSMGDDEQTPLTYATRAQAEAAIAEHLRDCRAAVRAGELSSMPDTKAGLRVVEV